MAVYTNDLRLKEITTGDENGTWGSSMNLNLSLIADAFGFGTKQLAADANQTFTIPDATADGARAMYLKITSAGALTATRTVTLGPNTVSKVWIIENATSGSQSIIIAQGSGATVTVPTGTKVMVYTDGAGAAAAVVNASPTETSGNVTSVSGTGTVNGLTLTGTVTTSGSLTLGGTLSGVSLTTQVTGTLPVANGGTGVTTSTGTGNTVLSTSPTLVTPALGTPSALVLTNATGLPPAGVTGTAAILGANTFTAAQEWATGASIASAATINLNTATGNRVHVTGTTTITAVTLTRGPRTVIFDGILTLTHHATNNNLPGGANITTAAGDRAVYESDGTTVYCTSYVKASGQAVNDGTTVGTWVPSYSFDFGSATYSVQQGWYFKVGKMVVAGFSLSTNSLSGTSGGAWLTGLPIPFSSDTSSQGIRAKGVITRAQSFLGDHPCDIDNMNTIFNNYSTVGLVYRATSNGAITALNASDFSTAADSNRIDGFVVYVTD